MPTRRATKNGSQRLDRDSGRRVLRSIRSTLALGVMLRYLDEQVVAVGRRANHYGASPCSTEDRFSDLGTVMRLARRVHFDGPMPSRASFPSYLDFLGMLRDRHHWANSAEAVRATGPVGRGSARALLGAPESFEQAATALNSSPDERPPRGIRRRFTYSILDRGESFLGNRGREGDPRGQHAAPTDEHGG